MSQACQLSPTLALCSGSGTCARRRMGASSAALLRLLPSSCLRCSAGSPRGASSSSCAADMTGQQGGDGRQCRGHKPAWRAVCSLHSPPTCSACSSSTSSSTSGLLPPSANRLRRWMGSAWQRGQQLVGGNGGREHDRQGRNRGPGTQNTIGQAVAQHPPCWAACWEMAASSSPDQPAVSQSVRL
jgi:hypothetical protein